MNQNITELIEITKKMVETYEALIKYKQMALMIMEPIDQWKFLQMEQLYPQAKELIKRMESGDNYE